MGRFRVRVAITAITKEERLKQEGAEDRIQGTWTSTRKEAEGSEHSDGTGEGKGSLSNPCQAQCQML